jgi:hypothetical protein
MELVHSDKFDTASLGEGLCPRRELDRRSPNSR